MKKHYPILATGLITVFIIAACNRYINPYEYYKPISVEKVYQLKKDSTSRSEVESLFGAPPRTSINERGNVYTYSYFGDSLNIQFNTSGIISRFSYVPELFRLDYEDHQDSRKIFRSRMLRKIIPGKTKVSDLEAIVGKPNRGETGPVRQRTTFFGRNENLIVYSTILGDVIEYELKPRN